MKIKNDYLNNWESSVRGVCNTSLILSSYKNDGKNKKNSLKCANNRRRSKEYLKTSSKYGMITYRCYLLIELWMCLGKNALILANVSKETMKRNSQLVVITDNICLNGQGDGEK